MSLKCSLFGCTYGDREIHREREEDGSEVVITIRETETCSRCGDVRVVSENKEVTTLETAADIVADDLEEETPTDRSPASGASTQSPEPGSKRQSDPGSRAGSGPTTGEPTPDDGGTVIPDAETDEVVTAGGDDPPAPEMADTAAVEDDGVILDEADSGEGDRDPGEWPGEPAGGSEEGGHRGSAGDTDGYDSVEWPTEPNEGDEDRDPDGPSGDAAGPGTDGVDPFGSSGNTVSVAEGEFYCPECGYTTTVESSSLRVGDYCPECHLGALEQRTE